MHKRSKLAFFAGPMVAVGLLCATAFYGVSAAPSEQGQASRNPRSAVKNNQRANSQAPANRGETAKQSIARAEVLREDKIRQLCENRQNTIENKVRAFGGSADKNLTRLNGVLDKVVELKESSSIAVPGYETYLSDVASKQEAASASIQALKSLASDFDCQKPETAVTLLATKEAVAKTRDSLKEYKQSLKSLLGALSSVVEQAESKEQN